VIINLRGNHGSGKTTVVRGFLTQHGGTPRYGALGLMKPEAYSVVVPSVPAGVYVLGPYQTATGGADNIQPYPLICKLVSKYAAMGHVVFEGVLISTTYGAVGELMERSGEGVMIFLDTPLEQCIRNVQSRRDLRGDARPFDSAQLKAKMRSIATVRERVIREGKLRVVDADPSSATETIVQLLKDESRLPQLPKAISEYV
jgi:hypothetical protein